MSALHVPEHFPEHYSDFTVKWASLEWEIQQALALRRDVFCQEQGLFEHSDRDDIDDQAQCLVAIANHGGWPDKVVGTVRIHQYSAGVWWGSRLAVQREFRHHAGIGAALIRLAVGSANGMGCTQFFAQVQQQNEMLFQKLHWHSRYPLTVRQRPHVMMEAELARYPACHTPHTGYVLKGQVAATPDEIAPCLLHVHRDAALQRNGSHHVAH